jgi:RNA polymerase sigma-70 factor (ECF subfamily)
MGRDDHDFEAFYRRELLSVFQAAYLMSGNRAAAEDATQEAFARALQRWDRLRGASWAGAWVMTTALNAVRRSLRRRPATYAEARLGPGEEEVVDLWREVARLPDRQRAAVVLVYRAGLSTEETAQALGRPAGTIRADLTHARRALRMRLKEDDDDQGPAVFADGADPRVGPPA